MDSTTTAKLVGCTTLAVDGCINTSSSGVIDFVYEHFRMVCGLLFTAIAISHLVYYPTMIEVIKRFYEPYFAIAACKSHKRLLLIQSHIHIFDK